MASKIQLSLITPAHNEELLIGEFVRNAVHFLHRRKISGEIIVAENGSQDRTFEVVRKLLSKFPELGLIHLENGNKGRALKEAMQKARGEFLVTLDTDLWDESFISRSLKLLQTDCDFVVGSKNAPGSSDRRTTGHKLITTLYNFAFKFLFNLRASDTKARFAARRRAILPLVAACRTEDLMFDTELIIRAERTHLREAEVSVDVSLAYEKRPQRYSYLSHLGKMIADFLTLITVLRPSFNRVYLAFLAVLIGAAFLRFWHYQNWFFYQVDEEHYSFMTRMITVDHHFPLIGGPISGTRLYMAPWFLYFSAFWFFLVNNSPLVYGVITTVLGLGTLGFIYLIGKRLASPAVGVLAALLYAVSLMMILFDRHQWNVTLLPLVSVLTMYFLMRWRDEGRLWLILTAAVVSFGISSTFTAFAVLLFALTVVIFAKKPFLKKEIVLFLGIIAAAHLPLVLFDVRHDFWLVRALGDFFFHPAYAAVPFVARVENTVVLLVESLGKALVITHPLDVADETSICTSVSHFVSGLPSQVLALAILIISAWLTWKKRLGKDAPWIFGLLVINIFSLVFFRADPSERHWLPFYPFFFLLTAIVLIKLWQSGVVLKIVSALVIICLIGTNLYSFLNSWASYGWADQSKAVQYIITNTVNRQFYLDSVGASCHGWGYRYQFTMANHEPAASYLDYDFSWLYPLPPSPSAAAVRVTILSPDKNTPETAYTITKRAGLNARSYQSAKFGNVEVYLERINAEAK